MYQPPKRRKLSKAERQAIYDKYDGHCAYCGEKITLQQLQVDHVIPMEFHEVYKATGQNLDDLWNMLPACRSCNHYKSTLTLDKFRQALENQPAVLLRDNATYKIAVRYGTVRHNPKPIKFYFELF